MTLGLWLDRLLDMYASRLAGAVFCTLMVAFAAHAATMPHRLPPFGAIGLEQLGLADFSQALPVQVDEETRDTVQEQVEEARSAAKPYVQQWLEDHPEGVARINQSGAALGLLLLLGSLAARMAREPKIRTV